MATKTATKAPAKPTRAEVLIDELVAAAKEAGKEMLSDSDSLKAARKKLATFVKTLATKAAGK